MIPIASVDDDLLLLIEMSVVPNPCSFKLLGLIEIEKNNNWYSNKAIIEYNDKRYLKTGSFLIMDTIYVYTLYAVTYNENMDASELTSVKTILDGII